MTKLSEIIFFYKRRPIGALRNKKECEKRKASPPLLFIAFFTSHRSPLSEYYLNAWNRLLPDGPLDGCPVVFWSRGRLQIKPSGSGDENDPKIVQLFQLPSWLPSLQHVRLFFELF